MAHVDTEALRTEWSSLFDKVLEAGRSLGAENALTSLMETARSQLTAGGTISMSAPTHQKPSVRGETPKRESSAPRAPNGMVRRIVIDALKHSSRPIRVQEIIDWGDIIEGAKLKDTSVRMAIAAMVKKGEVKKTDRSEWLLTEAGRAAIPMPSESDVRVMREAA